MHPSKPSSSSTHQRKEGKKRKGRRCNNINNGQYDQRINDDFWEFLHIDKDTANLFLNIIFEGGKAHLQDSADSELFMDTKTIGVIHNTKNKIVGVLAQLGNQIVSVLAQLGNQIVYVLAQLGNQTVGVLAQLAVSRKLKQN
ncbi:hypothetical protein L6452_25086 [Arctium lappa]|uniref:Uncharacterized protein n=1 Tax=Arctium lappa TaxID=4217 RepID=A0ACB9AA21_ARCLA|nr:hypothetical protein L6452_25086 [Arctium lappa]